MVDQGDLNGLKASPEELQLDRPQVENDGTKDLVPNQYKGLSSEVVEELWVVPVYTDQKKYQSELARRDQALRAIKQQEAEALEFEERKTGQEADDQVALAKVRNQIGIPVAEPTTPQQNVAALAKVREILDKRAAIKPQNAPALERIYRNLEASGDRAAIAKLILDETYLAKRLANYPQTTEYNQAWEAANQDQTLPIKLENDWIYRGVMRERGQETQTRGSLNINVTPKVISELDNLIKTGVIKGNYKFGDPGAQSSGLDRHDAVTIYFLEKPSEEAISQISAIAKESFRGNELIGDKVADGFYMSEVGSISDKQASEVIAQINAIDPGLGEGVRRFLTLKDGRAAMSEAQFYSLKETLVAFGLDVTYKQSNISVDPIGQSA